MTKEEKVAKSVIEVAPETPESIEVKKVVMHRFPDLDTIATYWLACHYPDRFGMIQYAPIEFWSQGPPPDGRTAAEHEAEGTICFDVGEGRFDHHPHGKCLDKCATDLVAEWLGVSERIEYQQILDYIRMHDLEGPTILSRTLRNTGTPEEIVRKAILHETFSLTRTLTNTRKTLKNPHNFIRWVARQLEMNYQRQLHFWTTVREEFESKARRYSTSNGERSFIIAVIESEVPEVGSFSRVREGGFCSVCVHRDPSSGHVFISGRLSSSQFQEIAKCLRVWEMQNRGISDEYLLGDLTESKMRLCPCWYLPQNIGGEVYIVMCGGQKAFEVEPSVLNLEQLTKAVILALDERVLAPECPQSHCLYRMCNFYPFGFNRCQRIRDKWKSSS